MMQRRQFILTSLGALAALPFASQVVENVSAEPEPKVPIAELYISVSQDVNEALSGLGPYPVQTSSHVIDEQAWQVWAERRGFDPVQEKLRRDAMYRGPTGPVVSIGSLNISSQAEVDAFLDLLADAIYKANRRSA